jgi:hypothetical protein
VYAQVAQRAARKAKKAHPQRAGHRGAVDGVAQQISYTDLHTANVATQAEPTKHVLGAQVDLVVVDTEAVGQGVLPRHAFNRHLDSMISDIELQCAFAKHESWHFFGPLISKHLNSFFKNNAQHELETVRSICLQRFTRLWLDVRNERRI